ncbi:AraC-like DNA-binding protein/uncharacterized membrane protein YqhA [Dysgonomonadaceae bacterium PH5-43]|nr:AraC-like DNA-binding protein/uncharacterized membrane protein YqhA [Dysgonomonadaceae bacterium PH5-43]
MLSELHIVLTYFSTGMIFAFGMCFLFLKTPESPILHNYRTARLIMAVAYILLAAAYILFATLPSLDIVSTYENLFLKLSRVNTLIIAVFQALLFTYTLISLIDLRFVTLRKIIIELIPIALFSSLLFISLNSNPLQEYFNVIFYIYLLYYFSMLVRYTFTFLREYRSYTQRVDNYFSEEEVVRLRWIQFAFFAALVIGIGAFLLSFSDLILHYILFMIFFMCFYIYFGIQFINYAFLFGEIKPLLEEETTLVDVKEQTITKGEIVEKISCWIEEKRFTEKGITIDHLSREFLTNRTYVSKHINSVYNRTFNEWVNDLRIEEAKKLFTCNPKLSIGGVSEKVGYANQSHFTREFSKREGLSPSHWINANS